MPLTSDRTAIIPSIAVPVRRPFPWPMFALQRDDRTMLRLTLLCAALTASLIAAKGLTFPPADAVSPLLVCMLLLGTAAFYHFVRPAPNFVLTAKALMVLVAFSTVYSMMMYGIATGGQPLADALLARCDAALGLSAPATVRWTVDRPAIAWLLGAAYFSLIPQTILAIAWLGLSDRRGNLDTFLVRFMLGGLITAVGFYWWPAAGTYGAAHNLPVPSYCQKCLEHLEALRSGSHTVITWRETEGLITFPSFHTIWALLLAAAFYRTRLFWPLALLNVLVVVSTITTGMHYYVDVLAGLLISAFVMLAWKVPIPAAAPPLDHSQRNKKGASDAPSTLGVAG
jgi:membrane-associated phospholipid phosphatase